MDTSTLSGRHRPLPPGLQNGGVFVVFFSPHRGSRFRPPHVAIYLRMRRIEAWCKHGRLPERPMGADCKSVGLCLRRFESYICHTKSAPILFARVGADFFCACTEVERALATQAPASAQGCRGCRGLRGLGMGTGGWFQGECRVETGSRKALASGPDRCNNGLRHHFCPDDQRIWCWRSFVCNLSEASRERQRAPEPRPLSSVGRAFPW